MTGFSPTFTILDDDIRRLDDYLDQVFEAKRLLLKERQRAFGVVNHGVASTVPDLPVTVDVHRPVDHCRMMEVSMRVSEAQLLASQSLRFLMDDLLKRMAADLASFLANDHEVQQMIRSTVANELRAEVKKALAQRVDTFVEQALENL